MWTKTVLPKAGLHAVLDDVGDDHDEKPGDEAIGGGRAVPQGDPDGEGHGHARRQPVEQVADPAARIALFGVEPQHRGGVALEGVKPEVEPLDLPRIGAVVEDALVAAPFAVARLLHGRLHRFVVQGAARLVGVEREGQLVEEGLDGE